MNSHILRLPAGRQAVVDRFVAACEADERVLAAFLGGSHARGEADAYSDLDLGLITTDAAYEDSLAGLGAFIRRLGEPIFLESFGRPYIHFFILADGTECELALGREGDFRQIHAGPFHVLLDKTGILRGVAFEWPEVDRAEQSETLRRLVAWFWHDLAHFTAAIGRGQLWWAQGQLEILRLVCVNLARLDENFAAEADGYEKVEKAVPLERLSPLEATVCPLERDAMLRAALAIVRFYRALARPLARAHGIPYPDRLDRIMSDRLEALRDARPA